MKLRSLNKIASFLILLIFSSFLNAEEEINIWSKPDKKKIETTNQKKDDTSKINKINISNTNNLKNSIKIDDKISDSSENINIFGIYDPAENDFNLNMWNQTDADKIRSSINRINKIKLSNSASKLFEKTILSFAYPPKGMTEKEFIDFKIEWMVKNKKIELIEIFLIEKISFPSPEQKYKIDITDEIKKLK